MLRNLPIALRLHIIVLIMLVAIGLVAWSGQVTLHDRLLAERKEQCRMLVMGAIGHLHSLHDQAARDVLSEGQAKAASIDAVAAMSSHLAEYLWINDTSPAVVWHPRGELIGRDVSEYRDADGIALFRRFVESTAGNMGGFVPYLWPKPGETEPKAKLSYVARFEPWGWIVGSGVYIDDIEASFHEASVRITLQALAAGIVGSVVVWLLGGTITSPLGRLTRTMQRLAEGEDVLVPDTTRRDEIGCLTRAMAVFRASLLQREEARRAHDKVLREAKTVFDNVSEGILVTDAANRIKLVNPAFSRITGYASEEVVGKTPKLLSSGRHDPEFYRVLWQSLTEHGEWHGEVWNRSKSGDIYPEALSISAVRAPDGGVDGYIATFLDITERKRRETRMRWRAEHDVLTGLANRAQFEARLADAVRLARAHEGSVALLYIDLDGFKPVNDTHGHAVGDTVLRRAAKRIRALVRGEDVVARLGGDEFAVIIPGLENGGDAGHIAEKLVAGLAKVFDVNNSRVQVGASIGVALYPADAGDAVALVAAADAAMYQAKAQGRGGFAFAGAVGDSVA
jgi:diguanylate cyclase (GGDEF)-like protein/PAS domain S-box-containing protein